MTRARLRRGLPVRITAGGCSVDGAIDTVRPEQLVIRLDAVPAGLARGADVVLAGAGLPRSSGRVLALDGERLTMERPRAVQSHFRSRRQHPRLAVAVPVWITGDGWAAEARTVDLSESGALLELAPGGPPLRSGQEVHLRLALVDAAPAAVSAVVRYVGPGSPAQAGVQFRLMSPSARTQLTGRLARARTEPAGFDAPAPDADPPG